MNKTRPPREPGDPPFGQVTPELYRRAEALLDELLERSRDSTLGADLEQRRAWLECETADDPVLRARVETLVREHDRDLGFLDAPVLERASQQAIDGTRQRPIGERVGSFRVLEILGAGGMGEVYLAEDERLGRRVALKLLPTELIADSEQVRRFRREARVLSALDHPGILTVYELVEEGGLTCLATERVEGETLRERLAHGPLPWTEAVEIARQVADALAAAHEAGVVHCDVKPENVMVRRDGRVKVLDFGIARLIRRGDDLASLSAGGGEHTGSGLVLGTPAYLSPEQIRGLELDGRSDLFSLGVMLFELLTGGRPFAEGSIAQTISAILERPAPSPAERGIVLPAGLEAILQRLLRKEREQRYLGARELVHDLKRLQRNEDLRGTRADGGVPRRFSGALALVGVAALVVAVALAWFAARSMRSQPTREPGTILLAAFDNTTGEEVFDRTLWRALAVALEQSPHLALFPEEMAERTLRAMDLSPDERISGEVARAICERHGISVMVTGSIAAIGESYVVGIEAVEPLGGEVIARELVQATGREEVVDALARAARSVRGRLGEPRDSVARYGTPVALATTASLDAWRAYALGRDRSAAGAYHDAVPLLARAIEIDPAFAHAHAELGRAFLNLGDDSAGQSHTETAFRLSEQAGERERLHIAQQYYRSVVGDLDRTIEVLEVWRATYPRDHVPLANIALHYSLTGDHDRSLEAAREATRLLPGDVVPYLNEASAWMALGRYDEARDTFERAASRGLASRSLTLRQSSAVVAWLQGDRSPLESLQEEVAGTPGEPLVLGTRAALAAAAGQRRLERDLVRRALELANQPGLAGRIAFEASMRSAAFGDCEQAVALADRMLALTDERWFTSGVAIALALCGASERAETLIEDLVARHPQERLVATEALPVTLAVNALYRNEPDRALELLRTASRYERGLYAALWPAYVRGLAHLQGGEPQEAARELERVAASEGILTLSRFAPPRALALLGLARAKAMAGDHASARAAYEQVLDLWSDGDLDLAALLEAREELANLGSLPGAELPLSAARQN